MGSSCSASASVEERVDPITPAAVGCKGTEQPAAFYTPRIEPGKQPLGRAGIQFLERARSQTSRDFGEAEPIIAAPIMIRIDGDGDDVDEPFDEKGRLRPFDYEHFALVHIPSAVYPTSAAVSSSSQLTRVSPFGSNQSDL